MDGFIYSHKITFINKLLQYTLHSSDRGVIEAIACGGWNKLSISYGN